MARFVIDAALAIRIAAAELQPWASHSLLAPVLMRSQVLNEIYARVRRGEMTEEAGLDLNAEFGKLKIRYLGDRVMRHRAWKLAASAGLSTTYPAEYIALTQLQADALVTDDPDLAELAAGSVPCAPVADLISP